MGARARYIAHRYIRKKALESLPHYPQIACLAFDEISTQIMVDGRYEREELAALERHLFPKMHSRRVCLDIGANIGNHSLFFADHFEQVVAFEPHPRLFRLLELNAELKNNVKAVNLGLSNEASTVYAQAILGNIATTKIGRDSEDQESVAFEVRPLDDVEPTLALDTIDLVKIDVEGHETEAIQGAENTLRKFKPIVLVEVLATEIQNGTSEAIKLLDAFGYKHLYELRSHRPFARAPKSVSRLVTGFLGLVFDYRPPKHFTVEKIEKLETRNYLMIIASPAEI